MIHARVPPFWQLYACTFNGISSALNPQQRHVLDGAARRSVETACLLAHSHFVFSHGGKLVAVDLVPVRLDCQRLVEDEPHGAELAVE
jgi:hypothetical protein